MAKILTKDLLLKMLAVSNIITFLCLFRALYNLEQVQNKESSETGSFVRTSGFEPHIPHSRLHALAQRTFNRSQPAVFEGHIVMDWIGDSDYFTFINYKSLESVLRVYPRARVTVNLIAPNGANYYKIGNLLSKHYFQKYTKYGYRLETKVIHSPFRRRLKMEPFPLGAAYWRRYFNDCCDAKRAADMSRHRYIPAHVYFYRRFLSLWARGGLYSDFSWYHVKPLSQSILPVQSLTEDGLATTSTIQYQGATIKTVCDSDKDISRDKNATCRSSVLMAFSPHNPVVECVLLQYNNSNSPLMECIEDLDVSASTTTTTTTTADSRDDRLDGGATCIDQALTYCFRIHNLRNAFDDEKDDVESAHATTSTSTRATSCAAPSPRSSTHDRSTGTAAVGPVAMCELNSRQYHRLLWVDHRDGESNRAERDIRFKDSAIWWLGVAAFEKNWTVPSSESLLASSLAFNPLPVPGPFSALSALLSNFTTVKYNPESLPPPDVPPFDLRILSSVSLAEQGYINKLRKNEIGMNYLTSPPVCHRYQLKNAVAPNSMISQASTSCALHFVVPGFMKAGTTYLFGTLLTHPQLLPALRGVSFKETGCYMPENMARNKIPEKYFNRMDCFPYVEAGERMYFGDGTVYYNSRRTLPAYLLADNPNIKVIFAIRNPVDRAQSHHRFSYRTLAAKFKGDMNVLVEQILDRSNGNAMELHDLAVAAVEESNPVQKQAKIDHFVSQFQRGAHSEKNEDYRKFASIITYSVYFPHIYYWFSKIPKGNIVVVPTEFLKPNRIEATRKLRFLRNLTTPERYNAIASSQREKQRRISTMAINSTRRTQAVRRMHEELNSAYMVHQYNRLFRFLNLPEVTTITDADAHTTGTKLIPAGHMLNSTMKQLLKEFYHPFNQLLEDLLGGNLGYNSGS